MHILIWHTFYIKSYTGHYYYSAVILVGLVSPFNSEKTLDGHRSRYEGFLSKILRETELTYFNTHHVQQNVLKAHASTYYIFQLFII